MKVTTTPGQERLNLKDGTYLLLMKRKNRRDVPEMTNEEFARNVFRMTKSGEEIWRIKTDRDSFGSPFIKLFLDSDPRRMANWDGLKYIVDLETGEAEEYAYSP